MLIRSGKFEWLKRGDYMLESGTAVIQVFTRFIGKEKLLLGLPIQTGSPFALPGLGVKYIARITAVNSDVVLKRIINRTEIAELQ